MNANIINIPVNGFPLPIANAIMACVVPQGMKIVNAPRIAGAKILLLLDWFLIVLVRNLGG